MKERKKEWRKKEGSRDRKSRKKGNKWKRGKKKGKREINNMDGSERNFNSDPYHLFPIYIVFPLQPTPHRIVRH